MNDCYLFKTGWVQQVWASQEGGRTSVVNVNTKIVISEVSIPARLLGYDLVKCCCHYLRALIVFRVNKVCYNMLFQDTRENGFSDLDPRQK